MGPNDRQNCSKHSEFNEHRTAENFDKQIKCENVEKFCIVANVDSNYAGGLKYLQGTVFSSSPFFGLVKSIAAL